MDIPNTILCTNIIKCVLILILESGSWVQLLCFACCFLVGFFFFDMFCCDIALIGCLMKKKTFHSLGTINEPSHSHKHKSTNIVNWQRFNTIDYEIQLFMTTIYKKWSKQQVHIFNFNFFLYKYIQSVYIYINTNKIISLNFVDHKISLNFSQSQNRFLTKQEKWWLGKKVPKWGNDMFIKVLICPQRPAWKWHNTKIQKNAYPTTVYFSQRGMFQIMLFG